MRKAKPLLLNDSDLHARLTQKLLSSSSPAEAYIESKLDWMAQTSVAFCETLGTDCAIAEGGAAGQTFRHKDMETGFAVLAVAGRVANGEVTVLDQQVVHRVTYL